MLRLTQIAELDVSAASGLVALADELCVVADDELFLARYDRAGRPSGRVPLFVGELAEAHATRKREKPDLESLCRLPDGRLLALGSGSTRARERGVLIDVAQGYSVQEIALGGLYQALGARVRELNIEGAAVHGDALFLAQRGNGGGTPASIELDLARVLRGLAHDAALPADALRAIHAVALPAIEGVPLGLTDLAPHARGLLFCAAAEPSADSYDDAPCAGSAVGLLSVRGELLACERVDVRCKLEGIASALEPSAQATGREALLLVADPDDRAQRAPLFTIEFTTELTASS